MVEKSGIYAEGLDGKYKFLDIKEIQIKITQRFHLTPVRIATIKNMLARMPVKRNPHTLLWEM
jgi:hypothetical protein